MADEVEFICAANGSGTVKPKLVWNIDGINADASTVKSWTVSRIMNKNRERDIFRSLTPPELNLWDMGKN
jgi:hypothetical protein